MVPSCSWARVVVCVLVWLGCAWSPAAAGPHKDLAGAENGAEDGAEDGADGSASSPEDRNDGGASLAGSGSEDGGEGTEDGAEDGGAGAEDGGDGGASAAVIPRAVGVYWLRKKNTYVAKRRQGADGWAYKRFRPEDAGHRLQADARRTALNQACAWQVEGASNIAAAAAAAAAGA